LTAGSQNLSLRQTKFFTLLKSSWQAVLYMHSQFFLL
jgi:hypothetical protein